jgi:hypothetical protein
MAAGKAFSMDFTEVFGFPFASFCNDEKINYNIILLIE